MTIGELLKKCREISKLAKDLEEMLSSVADAFEATDYEIESEPEKPKPGFKKPPSGPAPDLGEVDISVLSRVELVKLCHRLGYDEADTKAKRVKKLREMVEAKKIVSEDVGDEKKPSFKKPGRPTLKKPAKPFRPRLNKG